MSRREALRSLGLLGLGLTSTAALLAACDDDSSSSVSETHPTHASTAATATTAAGGAESRPNVLLIIADDMRYDVLRYMPNVRRLIQKPGRTFTQGRCNVPLCQPSRVGLMTGQMSKFNDELGIGFHGTTLLDRDNCLGKWMYDAGYRCGFFGKYINFWDGFGGVDAPAGYETWRELIGLDNGYGTTVHLNTGTTKVEADLYSSDYLAKEAGAFIDGGGPFMCIVTPTQPHTPFNPRKDLRTKWSNLDWHIVDEVDVSDKPSWIQTLPPLTAIDKAKIRRDVRGSLRELSAVDDMVHQIISGMAPDVLANTIVVFTSDNGVHCGEHRRRGAGTKSGPYDVGLRVPLLVRGPGFAPGADITAPSMVFQDIAATFLKVAGATAGLPSQTGLSLVDVCARPHDYAQRVLLHEIGEGFETATGDGLSTGPDSALGFRKLYRYPSVRSNTGGPYVYEAYDLDTDSDELSNWANDERRLDERNALEAQLDALLA